MISVFHYPFHYLFHYPCYLSPSLSSAFKAATQKNSITLSITFPLPVLLLFPYISLTSHSKTFPFSYFSLTPFSYFCLTFPLPVLLLFPYLSLTSFSYFSQSNFSCIQASELSTQVQVFPVINFNPSCSKVEPIRGKLAIEPISK